MTETLLPSPKGFNQQMNMLYQARDLGHSNTFTSIFNLASSTEVSDPPNYNLWKVIPLIQPNETEKYLIIEECVLVVCSFIGYEFPRQFDIYCTALDGIKTEAVGRENTVATLSPKHITSFKDSTTDLEIYTITYGVTKTTTYVITGIPLLNFGLRVSDTGEKLASPLLHGAFLNVSVISVVL